MKSRNKLFDYIHGLRAELIFAPRIFAVWKLGTPGDQTAIDYLIEMLDDADERGGSIMPTVLRCLRIAYE
jgi:hypothetical protein